MAKNKAELEKENFELRASIEAHKSRVEDAKADIPPDFKPEAKLTHDPYAGHNALDIIGDIPANAEYPAGQALAWKSPRYRATRGMRGWIPLKWGDEYTGEEGELLSQYIPEAPPRMLEQEKMDSYIRRGDVILCRIDKALFDFRQEDREAQAAKRRGTHDAITHTDRRGVSVVGEGFTSDANPRFTPPKE